MALAIRYRGDAAAEMVPIPAFVVRRELDPAAMAALQGRSEAEIRRRFAGGHRAYVALLEGEPAAGGWVATRSAAIGELRLEFAIPEGERYLWNFVTLASHRGMGIYPRLLDAIVREESREAERFWIAYAPENHASASGIRRAGFTTVAELSFDESGRPAVRGDGRGGVLAARLLGLEAAAEALTPCWRCARAAAFAGPGCSGGGCTCDYQRSDRECAA